MAMLFIIYFMLDKLFAEYGVLAFYALRYPSLILPFHLLTLVDNFLGVLIG